MVESRRLNDLRTRLYEGAVEYPLGSAVIALSGGADSAIAGWLTVEQEIPVRAVHVDHGLPASPAMRRAAEAVAGALGLPFEVKSVTVADGASPEGQARVARYDALLGELSDEEYAVTGHTADDQAETVLMNILRGSGLRGLSGIPVRRPGVFRPILHVTRSETRELATLLGLPWRDDPANQSADPVRNRVRNELIPLLEAEFNPQLRLALVSLSEAAATDTTAASVQVRRKVGSALIARPELFAAGRGAARLVLREELRRLRGPHTGPRSEVERLLSVAWGETRSTELSGGWEALTDGPWLLIRTAAGEPRTESAVWQIPGDARFGTWAFHGTVTDQPPRAIPFGRFVAVADAERLPTRCSVRAAYAKDQLDGVSVFEVLRQVGVAPERRGDWPVVETGGDIWWVPGARISRSVWIGAGTRRYLWVHAELETL